MSIHVAILYKPYLDLILAGRKTVESRLTKTTMPPFKTVEPGERLFLKASGGSFMATAIASAIEFHENLTPNRVGQLRRRWNARVRGDDAYWRLKRNSRFATFVTLAEVEPIGAGPVYPKSMKAWHVVDDQLSPLRDFVVTAGALRNTYALLPGPTTPARSPLALVLPDGREVSTDFARGRMLRWRGWGKYYREHGVVEGGRVRFVLHPSRRVHVAFLGPANR